MIFRKEKAERKSRHAGSNEAGWGPVRNSEVFFTVLIDGGRWWRVEEGLGGNCPCVPPCLRLVRKFVAAEPV